MNKSTTNRRIYRQTMNNCPWWYSDKRTYHYFGWNAQRSWKKYRKTQYK